MNETTDKPYKKKIYGHHYYLIPEYCRGKITGVADNKSRCEK